MVDLREVRNKLGQVNCTDSAFLMFEYGDCGDSGPPELLGPSELLGPLVQCTAVQPDPPDQQGLSGLPGSSGPPRPPGGLAF